MLLQKKHRSKSMLFREHTQQIKLRTIPTKVLSMLYSHLLQQLKI